MSLITKFLTVFLFCSFFLFFFPFFEGWLAQQVHWKYVAILGQAILVLSNVKLSLTATSFYVEYSSIHCLGYLQDGKEYIEAHYHWASSALQTCFSWIWNTQIGVPCANFSRSILSSLPFSVCSLCLCVDSHYECSSVYQFEAKISWIETNIDY